MLPKEEAKATYLSIVSKLRDPALLGKTRSVYASALRVFRFSSSWSLMIFISHL